MKKINVTGKTLKNYLLCMRMPHYIKNLIVFLPIFFNKSLQNTSLLWQNLIGFLAFCILSSGIYVLNDIQDIERDKLHERKRFRPIPSGKISTSNAYRFSITLILLSLVLSYVIDTSLSCFIWPMMYFFINLIYSFWGKHIPILDITLLSAGYPIRLMYGGALCNISISSWLFLTVLCLSFYFGIGKRRGEYKVFDNTTRPVLKSYSQTWLDGEMYMMLGISIMFYSLWAVEKSVELVYTVPLVLIICMYYDLIITNKMVGGGIQSIL